MNLPPGVTRGQPALGIQQPWAELILRGTKTLEVRSRPTQVRGRILIYASRRFSRLAAASVAAGQNGLSPAELITGQLLGTVDLVDCRPALPADARAACVPARLLVDQFVWTLADPCRWEAPVAPRFLPYGVWFYPFERRSSTGHDVR